MKAGLIIAVSVAAFLGLSNTSDAKVAVRSVKVLAAVEKAEVYRAGFIEPNFRDSVLAKAWTYEVGQTERAGCIPKGSWKAYPTAQSADGKAVDSGFYVFGVNFQDSAKARPANVEISCGKGVPFFHTHPYQSCDDSAAANCKSGGWFASLCEPSKADLRALYDMKAPFGVIQCDRFAFRFFFLADVIRT